MSNSGKIVVGLGLNVEPFVSRIDKEALISVVLEQFSEYLKREDLEDMTAGEIWCYLLRDNFIDSIDEIFWLCEDNDYLDHEYISNAGAFLYCPKVWPWTRTGNEPKDEDEARALLIRTVKRLVPTAAADEINNNIQFLQLFE